MRVIKRGVTKDKVRYRISCNGCGSVLDFERGEAKVVPDDRDADYLEVECPVCQASVRVDASQHEPLT